MQLVDRRKMQWAVGMEDGRLPKEGSVLGRAVQCVHTWVDKSDRGKVDIRLLGMLLQRDSDFGRTIHSNHDKAVRGAEMSVGVDGGDSWDRSKLG